MKSEVFYVQDPKASPPVFVQDPSASRNYVLDWTNVVSPQTLQSAVWSSSPAGLTISGQTLSSIRASAQISGGAAGTTYTVSVRVTDSFGDIDEQSFLLRVDNT